MFYKNHRLNYVQISLVISCLFSGNIPPMVRLLQAYIAKAPTMVAESHKLVRETLCDWLQDYAFSFPIILFFVANGTHKGNGSEDTRNLIYNI